MNWWRRLFSAGEASEDSGTESSPLPAPPVASPSASDRDLALLLEPASLSDRMAALRRLQNTVREGDALRALQRARSAGHAPDELAVAGAHLCAQRGEPEAALALLRDNALPEGILLAADVQAEQGALPRALALVERVLARDIDTPGARERHERWRRQLGQGPAAAPPTNVEPTVLRPDAARSQLRIVGEAGRGGAGTVFEAIDDVLGRRVALKIYHRPQRERDKLVREARTAVELAAPGVIRVFDADPSQGFIVMEWVGAGSLKNWLSTGSEAKLSALSVWYPRLVATIANVHRRGWVHADLKPANVLFCNVESPVVSDFGLAQCPGHTEPGGSLGYLSPERIAGEPLGFRDDVFALGRILEDALDRLRPWNGAELASWSRVAAWAIAPAAERPQDAVSLLAELPFRRSSSA